jgi:ATP-binding cassette subfamily F protein 3
LLRATTDQFLIVADGRLEAFDGDLDDYRDWLFKTKLADPEETVPLPAPRNIEVPSLRKDPAPARPAAATPPAAGRRGQKRKEAAERQRISAARKPLESRLKRLDEQMGKLNEKKSALDAQLADPANYGEAQRDALKALILDRAYVARELAELEAEWLALHEQLETSN